MQLLQAQPLQGDELYHIYKQCKTALEQDGIYQWTAEYPSAATIYNDIEQGHLYALTDGELCIGAICLNEVQDKEYATVNWQDKSGMALVIHRLAIAVAHQGRGLARQLMSFAEQHARAHGYTSIRLDAYSDNKRTLRFYEQRGYVKRGEVYFAGRTAVFYCYELIL